MNVFGQYKGTGNGNLTFKVADITIEDSNPTLSLDKKSEKYMSLVEDNSGTTKKVL